MVNAPAFPGSNMWGIQLTLTACIPQGWQLFNWQAYQSPWDVPWGGSTTAATMAAWTISFAGTAFVLMPFAYTRIVGMPLWELTAAGQADFALWSEIVELVVTFAILGSVAARWVNAQHVHHGSSCYCCMCGWQLPQTAGRGRAAAEQDKVTGTVCTPGPHTQA